MTSPADTMPDITGVLLVNLGTPDAPTTAAVRRYLAEFLSDRRVVSLHPLLWKPILHGLILRTRPARVARAYASIWMQESGESPLRHYTRRQAERLQERFQGYPSVQIEWAMRYGRPSIETRLRSLHESGCRRILIAPLYPQYSLTTTASVDDAVKLAAKRIGNLPEIQTLPPYYAHPAYIDAIARGIESERGHSTHVLLSYHGLPADSREQGDPYYDQCVETTRLLRERLGMDAAHLPMSFQSRFGPKRWLQPYTSDTLRALAESGVRDIAVVSPGFAADCLETLEEMGVENRKLFLDAGGESYTLIPCLNDSDTGIDMLECLVRETLGFSD